MNERIRLLADEAAKYSAVMALATGESGDHLFTEKFAELIVKKCADICMEMAAKCAGLPGDGALAKDCAYWIKKDFGVDK